MPSSEKQPSAAGAPPATIDFEQPLNERMRTYLRLEFLYQQTLYHRQSSDAWATRAAVSSILEILAITARGDCRSDVLKELERQIGILNEFKSRSGIDMTRLNTVMTQLTALRTELSTAGGLLMQGLRESEFLNAIKHRTAIPGGTCAFDLPDYFHWLGQSHEVREQAFKEWLTNLSPLCNAVIELLWITRQNARPRKEIATGGVFQLALDRDTPSQLLRITLPAGTNLYPETSGSHHRCSIRFMEWIDVSTRPTQTSKDVPFLLTACT